SHRARLIYRRRKALVAILSSDVARAADVRQLSLMRLKPLLPRRILALNRLHEILDRHLRFSIRGVEGKFLSRRFAHGKDAAVLRGTIFNNGDQLHLLPDPRAEDDRELDNAYAGEISVRAKSATKDHTLVEASRLRRHARIFFESRSRPRRTAGANLVSASADF